jgi:hypothetical protein
MDPARRGYARSLKTVQVRNSGPPVLLRAAGMRNPLIKDAGTSWAKQAYSETADWPFRTLSRAVVCGSVRIASKKPSSLS